MRRILLYIVQLAILVGIAVWLADHPGHRGGRLVGIPDRDPVCPADRGRVVGVVHAVQHDARGLACGHYARRAASWRDARRAGVRRAIAPWRSAWPRRRRGTVRKPCGLRAAPIPCCGSPRSRGCCRPQAAALSGDEEAARRYFDALTDNEETAFLGLTGLLRQGVARKRHRTGVRHCGTRAPAAAGLELRRRDAVRPAVTGGKMDRRPGNPVRRGPAQDQARSRGTGAPPRDLRGQGAGGAGCGPGRGRRSSCPTARLPPPQTSYPRSS